MSCFKTNLARGQLGESKIACWLMARGVCVLPVYEKETDGDDFKGPRFYTPAGQFVAPDMFIMPAMEWIEAKHKTVFSWHRITRRWVTGIDLHHYAQYQRVQELSGRKIWLLFLHQCARPDDRDVAAGCPEACPVGLFGAPLGFLAEHENHRHKNWGRHGMVYWAHDTLRRLADISEFEDLGTATELPSPPPDHPRTERAVR